MEIPKELRGKEVHKFEDEILLQLTSAVRSTLSEDLQYMLLISQFYTQSFKPEMIEGYFYNVKTTLIEKDAIYFTVQGTDFFYEIEKFGILWSGDGFPIAKVETLSEFIDACINQDIKLIWRDK